VHAVWINVRGQVGLLRFLLINSTEFWPSELQRVWNCCYK